MIFNEKRKFFLISRLLCDSIFQHINYIFSANHTLRLNPKVIKKGIMP